MNGMHEKCDWVDDWIKIKIKISFAVHNWLQKEKRNEIDQVLLFLILSSVSSGWSGSDYDREIHEIVNGVGHLIYYNE